MAIRRNVGKLRGALFCIFLSTFFQAVTQIQNESPRNERGEASHSPTATVSEMSTVRVVERDFVRGGYSLLISDVFKTEYLMTPCSDQDCWNTIDLFLTPEEQANSTFRISKFEFSVMFFFLDSDETRETA